MKTCSQCSETLELDRFDIQSTGKLGRRADCKDCRKRFTRSVPGLIKAIYSFQVRKSKLREYTSPNYSEAELLHWAEAQPLFHQLYTQWVAADYVTDLKPSFDRSNDYVSYRLDNLQVMTWAQNNQKNYASQLNGTNTKKNHAVDMLDMEGNFVERFHSVSDAARKFNGIPGNITSAILQRVIQRKQPNGSTRSYTVTNAYGHRWRYSTQPNLNKEQANAAI